MTSLLEQVRLEVLASDGSGNLIENHSGQDGTTVGWVSPGADTLDAVSGQPFGYNGHALKLSGDGTTDGGRFVSGAIPINPGEWFNAVVSLNTPKAPGEKYSPTVNLQVDFRNADGVTLDSIPSIFRGVHDGGTWFTMLEWFVTGLRPAPAGTHHAVLSLAARGTTLDGASEPLGIGETVYAWEFMAIKGPTEASVLGVQFSDTDEIWQNVLAKSVSVTIERGGVVDGVTDTLNAGFITGTIDDPLATPDNNQRMRPGHPMRVTALAGGTWKAVGAGKIDTARTTYGGEVPRVVATVVDAMKTLRNQSAAVAKSGRFKQRIDAIMTGVAVPYEVIDTDANTTSATIDVDPQGTPLSQLKTVCDSLQGLFYVDKSNVLRCWANNSYPSQAPTVTFSDDGGDTGAVFYTGIDTAFDVKNMVNTLTVRKRALSEPNGEKVYGPYINEASVAQWGTSSAEITINDGAPAEVAASYLAVYAEPTIFPSSVTFNATEDIAQAVDLELYQAARVKFAQAGLDAVYRIVGLTHTIVADVRAGADNSKWLVTVRFKPLESTSSIVVTNPPGGASSGPADLVPFTREIQTGMTSIDFNGQSTATANVTFPKPYEVPPAVVATQLSGGSLTPRFTPMVATVTEDGCVLRGTIDDAATSTAIRNVRWVAIPAN